MIHAEDGEILQLNNVWTALAGYLLEDIPTISDWTRKAYGERNEKAKASIDVLYGLDEWVSEGVFEITIRDGTKLAWEFGSAPLGSLPDGRRSVISLAMDVTQRNQMENSLAKALAREEAILTSVPDIIVEVNCNKQYTWSNRAGFEFFGEDLLGNEAAYYFEGGQDMYDLVKPLFDGDENSFYIENWQRRLDSEKRLSTLSVREHEVLGLIITGKQNKAIAAQLGISHKTVETHRTSIMRKTEAQNIVHLLQMISAASVRSG